MALQLNLCHSMGGRTTVVLNRCLADLSALLRCLDCGSTLHITGAELACDSCSRRFPVIDGIPRFIVHELDEATRRTAESFGWEWTKGWDRSVFGSPDIDREIETSVFLEKTQGSAEDFAGALVLEAGCGFGRYSWVAQQLGAALVALDISDAVTSAQRNLGDQGNSLVIQADLLHRIPLAAGSFDFIFSLGVLHHAADAHRAFLNLVPLLRPGGEIAIWMYRKESPAREETFRKIREITLSMSYETLMQVSEILALVAQSPAVPEESKNRIPISSLVHNNFDWYSCVLREHFASDEVTQWFNDAGLENIRVHDWIHPDGYGGAFGVRGRLREHR